MDARQTKLHQFKRRQFLKAAGGSLAAVGVAGPAVAQSNPVIKWRLTSSFPRPLDTLYGSCGIIAKHIAEATDGNFQIQAFAAKGAIARVMR
jgi:TRAP-type mannitol/chloroaromatic compound transport system substrate-binding protein